MDLGLTRRGDYAVRAALDLAEAWDPREPDGGPYRKVRQVSEEMVLPREYTPQVLRILVRAGLVQARAGREGGYRLRRPPSSITLLEIVEAAEGPLAPIRCTLRGGPCRWDRACPAHPTWAAAAELFRERLAKTSLAHLAAADREVGGVRPS